jgi:hypothetical protein
MMKYIFKLLTLIALVAAFIGSVYALLFRQHDFDSEPTPSAPFITTSTVNHQPPNSPEAIHIPEVVLSAKDIRPRFNLSISSPTAGQQFVTDTEIEHKAQAIDPVKGDISYQIEWRDGSQRLLAKGSAFKLIRPAGQHVVTAHVTSSQGKSLSSAISYLITPGQNKVSAENNQAAEENMQNLHLSSNNLPLKIPTFDSNTATPQNPSPAPVADSMNNKLTTWIPYDGSSPADSSTGAASGTSSSNSKPNKKTSSKKQEKPKEPAPIAEDSEATIRLCNEPIKINLENLISSTTDNSIDWSKLDLQAPKSKQFVVEKDAKNPALISVDFTGNSESSSQLQYRVPDQQGRYSNFATINLNVNATGAHMLEGFEVPVVPNDPKYVYGMSSPGWDPELFSKSESSWRFAAQNVAGSGVGWRIAGSTLNPVEGRQAAFFHHSPGVGNAQIANTIYLKKEKRYKISLYTARAPDLDGNVERFLQIKVGGNIIDSTVKQKYPYPGSITFQKHFTPDFINTSEGNQELEISALQNKKEDKKTLLTLIDAVCVFEVNKR